MAELQKEVQVQKAKNATIPPVRKRQLEEALVRYKFKVKSDVGNRDQACSDVG